MTFNPLGKKRIEHKVFCFEYILFSLLQWYSEKKPKSDNDFSVLKSMKLLFFVVAGDKKKNYYLLDNVFDSFRALPLGHVESEIYSYLKNNDGELHYYNITNQKIIEKEHLTKSDWKSNNLIEHNIIEEVDESIEYIRGLNSNLVFQSAYELVDLSHAWYSWKRNFTKAKAKGIQSELIPPEDIKNENKIFAITAF